MSEWRPDGWDATKDGLDAGDGPHWRWGFEQGADAMLTALRKQDICDFRTLDTWSDGGQSGTLVYIPGEKDG